MTAINETHRSKNSSENRILTENLMQFFLNFNDWVCTGTNRAFVVCALDHRKVVLDRLLESLQI